MTDPATDPPAAPEPLPPTPPAAVPPAPAPAWTPTVAADADGWRPLAPAAVRIATLAGALGGAPFGIGLTIAPSVLMGLDWPAALLAGVVLVGVAAACGALLARARARRARWRLDERGLQVRRGLIWHGDLLVPRSRVQHLDLERGPLERRAGLATLVVHTAGTRLYALRQSGFADADAVALRDALLPERERDDDVL